MLRHLSAALLFLATAASAQAGPLDEAKARMHLNAIADGDIEVLMRDYADDAYMDWVGGPLDGRYTGKPAIRALWEKFITGNNGKPRPVKVGEFEDYAHPAGVSIVAEAEYGGMKPVKVWHLFVYRDGVLTTEVWQVAPSMQVH
jgi:ketosteroid isomerase-like protein